ncbi:MAG TPA: hypothetical protein VMT46_05610 [Anaerolineaceae bacterium]|nr:hypothetical protein [Anaerolineaceae bacterium]
METNRLIAFGRNFSRLAEKTIYHENNTNDCKIKSVKNDGLTNSGMIILLLQKKLEAGALGGVRAQGQGTLVSAGRGLALVAVYNPSSSELALLYNFGIISASP